MTEKKNGGFTLAETLVAMLLMSFVGLIVTGGISMGAQVYGRIVERSNAELLLSTTLMEMRDELDRAEEVTLTGDATNGYILVKYRSSNTNWRALKDYDEFDPKPEDGEGIYIVPIVPDKGYVDNTPGAPLPLVTKAAATEELYAEFTSITVVGVSDRLTEDGSINLDVVSSLKNGSFQVNGLVVKNKSGTVLARTGSDFYTIRALESVRVFPITKF